MTARYSSAATQNDQRFGLIIALCAATLFSTKPILIKWLYSLGVEVLPLIWLRMAMALPFYLIMGYLARARLASKPATRHLLKAASIGLLGYYLSSVLDLYGLQYVSAQLERLVLYAYPSMVVILGMLFFGQTFKAAIILPLLITYGGLALMYGHDMDMLAAVPGVNNDQLMMGAGLVLSAALTFACYLLFSKNSIRQLGSILFTCIAMTSATLAILVHQRVDSWLTGVDYPLVPEYSATIWLGIAALAIIATVLPSFLISAAIARIGPERTSMSGTIGPVATTALAVIFLGESLSLLSIAGMALVVFGVWRLSQIK